MREQAGSALPRPPRRPQGLAAGPRATAAPAGLAARGGTAAGGVVRPGGVAPGCFGGSGVVAGALAAPQPAAHPPAKTRQTSTAPARTSLTFFMENASGSEDDGRRRAIPGGHVEG